MLPRCVNLERVAVHSHWEEWHTSGTDRNCWPLGPDMKNKYMEYTLDTFTRSIVIQSTLVCSLFPDHANDWFLILHCRSEVLPTNDKTQDLRKSRPETMIGNLVL